MFFFFIILSTDKYCFLISEYKYEHTWVHIEKDKIWEDEEVKLFGRTQGTYLICDCHVNTTVNMTNPKLRVWNKQVPKLQQRQVILKTFLEYHFLYFSLTWIFCSRRANRKTSNHQEGIKRVFFTIWGPYTTSRCFY